MMRHIPPDAPEHPSAQADISPPTPYLDERENTLPIKKISLKKKGTGGRSHSAGGGQQPPHTSATPPLVPLQAAPHFTRSVVRTSALLLALALVLFCAWMGGTLLGIAKAYIDTAPQLDVEAIYSQPQGSFIYDTNGNLLTIYTGAENRIYATLDEIPEMLQHAFISVEDVRFNVHNGIDYKRLFSAFVNTISNSNTHGGSTITQQLIKNTLLTSEQTYKRKIQEAYLALQLEQTLSKEQILEAYLNTIFLGASNYGVVTAARDYFGKSLDQLTIRECATLAGITQNPNSYNPRRNYYVTNTPERTDDRTNLVLKRMVESGAITEEEYQAALADQLEVVQESSNQKMYDYPHFIEYVIDDVIDHMIELRGLTSTKAVRVDLEDEIRTGGYRIYTTLDPTIQETVQSSLANWRSYPRFADSTYSVRTYNNADGSTTEIAQPQAAAVVVENSTGYLRAIVGSRTTPTSLKTLNRAYESFMPVGSSIKPLTVYGPALDLGMNASTVLENTASPIAGWDNERGYPENYEGGGYTGTTTLRSALIHSYNTVAARILMEYVTIDVAKQYLVDLGVDPSHINATGSGLALGTSGITTAEMAGGFACIANGGEYREPLSFTAVKEADGTTVIDAVGMQDRRQVFKPSTAYQLTNLLEAAVLEGTGSSAQVYGIDTAGKTGTNDAYRGVCFSGFTSYYTASLWIGHDDYTPSFRYGTTGGGYAAPLWQDFMTSIHQGLPNVALNEENPNDAGVEAVYICNETGKLATQYCPSALVYFASDTQPTSYCTQHNAFNNANPTDQEDQEPDDPGTTTQPQSSATVSPWRTAAPSSSAAATPSSSATATSSRAPFTTPYPDEDVDDESGV